jgi:hypothetical protein
MTQEDITILRVHKSTRNRLKRLAITARESYDEIIDRLLEGGVDSEKRTDEELQRRKQALLKEGVSKRIVDLLGVSPYKTSLEDEKKIVGRAIRRKYGIE